MRKSKSTRTKRMRSKGYAIKRATTLLKALGNGPWRGGGRLTGTLAGSGAAFGGMPGGRSIGTVWRRRGEPPLEGPRSLDIYYAARGLRCSSVCKPSLHGTKAGARRKVRSVVCRSTLGAPTLNGRAYAYWDAFVCLALK